VLTTKLLPVEAAGLRLLPGVTVGETLCIVISGNCDMETTPLLAPFLDYVHAQAVRDGVRRVVFDCDALYFMNSTSLKSFILFVNKVKKLEPGDRYAVRFKINPQLGWQRRSLEAVRRFAVDIVSLD
jgi:hypothetical protein